MMNQPVYLVTRVDNKLIFYFESRNSFGKNPVLKVIRYVMFHKHGASYYNLGFGDYDPGNNQLSDTTISDNGDMRKILATVVSTLKIFFAENPDEIVHIDGSDHIRRAYYHKLIVDYSDLIETFYVVKGRSLGKIEPFQKGKSYEFILISRREALFLVEEANNVMVTSKKSIRLQEKKLIKLLSSMNAEDIFPEKTKKAQEDLKRAGFIKG
jgi:hypothetical protein